MPAFSRGTFVAVHTAYAISGEFVTIDFLIIGTLIGALIGLFHVWVDFARRMDDARSAHAGRMLAERVKAAYAAAWILTLWTVFGSYVLAFWLIALPLFVLFGQFRSGAKPVTVD